MTQNKIESVKSAKSAAGSVVVGIHSLKTASALLHSVPRIWTVAEANAAIPRVRQVLGDARAAQSRMRDEEAQVEDIRIIWGEQVKEPSCPDHAEFNERIARLALAKNELEQHSLQFEVIGCEVKDLDQGLVDFRGKLGSEEVYLCWRDGEGDIRFWHPLQGGFAQRRAIPGLR